MLRLRKPRRVLPATQCEHGSRPRLAGVEKNGDKAREVVEGSSALAQKGGSREFSESRSRSGWNSTRSDTRFISFGADWVKVVVHHGFLGSQAVLIM